MRARVCMCVCITQYSVFWGFLGFFFFLANLKLSYFAAVIGLLGKTGYSVIFPF